MTVYEQALEAIKAKKINAQACLSQTIKQQGGAGIPKARHPQPGAQGRANRVRSLHA